MLRWLRFNAVGAAGVLVQAGVLAALLGLTDLHYLAATAMAVEAAVLHNFFWHRRWTWSDRPGVQDQQAAAALPMLLRFHSTNGAVSIGGNLLFVWILAGLAGLHPIAANLASIAACSLLNFLLADRVVFITSFRA